MSGAGFMRLVKNVGESISKMAGKKSDSDKVTYRKNSPPVIHLLLLYLSYFSGLMIVNRNMMYWNIILKNSSML